MIHLLYLLVQSVLTPFRLLLAFFYKVLDILKQRTLVELFLKRIIGLFLSIIFLTPLIGQILLHLKLFFISIGFNLTNAQFLILWFFLLYLLLVLVSLFLHIFSYKPYVAD